MNLKLYDTAGIKDDKKAPEPRGTPDALAVDIKSVEKIDGKPKTHRSADAADPAGASRILGRNTGKEELASERRGEQGLLL